MSTQTAPQQLEFKAELKQLLDLIIHSLYTKKEIFLRELISNAADAIDKVRFQSLTDGSVLEGNSDWKIKLIADESAGTLTISDNGIGMSPQSIVDNLGTIAKSGTRAFLEDLRKANVKDRPELIGQFGVGFYSSFMVADKVTVISRLAGDKSQGVKWESDGQGQYTVQPIEKEQRGTDVTLHLREDAKQFLKPYMLQDIVKRYSDFIEHPIVMDVPQEKDGVKTTSTQTFNSRQALWLRPKNQIKPEEYNEFYHQVSRDFSDPLKTIHFAAEGNMEFRALLYLPAQKPMDFLWREPKSGLQLYVRRVLIMHDCEELLPNYMRFVKGMVDSSDLPLNVSREMLQHNPVLARIKSNLVNRILKTLEEMKAGEYDNYVKFYDEFGQVMKEGVSQDYSNKQRLMDLMLFESTKTEKGKYTTLAEYVQKMPSDQKEILYLCGDDRAQVEHSPYLEAARAAGQEVLFFIDPIDEFVAPYLGEYNGKKCSPVDKAAPAAPEQAEPQKQISEQLKGLCQALQSKLPEVKEVRISSRLKESAACLVADEQGVSAHLERLMERMGRRDELPQAKRILELNPDHPVTQGLQKLHSANPADPRIEDYARILYDQAVLAEGSRLSDPTMFAKRINNLLGRQLSAVRD